MDARKLAGSPIAYYKVGTGHDEWVLFLHAAFVDHAMFRAQVEELQERYNLLLVDVIGHGRSTTTEKGDSLDGMADWLYAIMKAEDIDKLHVVGVSLGALLAQDFANRHPDAIRSLACIGGYDINHFDPNLQKDTGRTQMLMMAKAFVSVKWFADANRAISAHTPEAQDEFHALNLRFPKKSLRYLASLNAMMNQFSTGPRSYPLLIGCGAFDAPSAIEAARAWHAAEPNSTLVVFEGAGHCANMDVPHVFNETLKAFWEEG